MEVCTVKIEWSKFDAYIVQSWGGEEICCKEIYKISNKMVKSIYPTFVGTTELKNFVMKRRYHLVLMKVRKRTMEP